MHLLNMKHLNNGIISQCISKPRIIIAYYVWKYDKLAERTVQANLQSGICYKCFVAWLETLPIRVTISDVVSKLVHNLQR
jgi:hypothetical protein